MLIRRKPIQIAVVLADVREEPVGHEVLVSEAEFDAILARLIARGLTHWADPFHRHEGVVSHNDGGRGLYWLDPNGHNLEILTVPYGGRPG